MIILFSTRCTYLLLSPLCGGRTDRHSQHPLHLLRPLENLNDYLSLPIFQVPERHPDNVPAHPAIPHNRSHHQQRRAEAPAGAQGPGESHSTGNVNELLNNDLMTLSRPLNNIFVLTPAGVLHVQGPNHRVCGVSLR